MTHRRHCGLARWTLMKISCWRVSTVTSTAGVLTDPHRYSRSRLTNSHCSGMGVCLFCSSVCVQLFPCVVASDGNPGMFRGRAPRGVECALISVSAAQEREASEGWVLLQSGVMQSLLCGRQVRYCCVLCSQYYVHALWQVHACRRQCRQKVSVTSETAEVMQRPQWQAMPEETKKRHSKGFCSPRGATPFSCHFRRG